MKKVFSALVFCLFVLTLAAACSNGGSEGQCSSDAQCNGQKCVNKMCVQCASDGHCNAQDKCMTCQGNQCVKQANCCTEDHQCGGKRCVNVPGKPYGRCQ